MGTAYRVVGIDPGLNITGYAVVDWLTGQQQLIEAGVVRSDDRQATEMRLAAIYAGVREVLESFRPQAAAIERLYSHYAHPTTAILMGHARGVIYLAAAHAQIPISAYAATQVKKLLTGSGRAPKSQMQQAVCREFGLAAAPEPPDVADALAIALCHLHFQHKAVLLP